MLLGSSIDITAVIIRVRKHEQCIFVDYSLIRPYFFSFPLALRTIYSEVDWTAVRRSFLLDKKRVVLENIGKQVTTSEVL